MNDHEITQTLRLGDPTVVAAIYDAYGVSLYDYALTMAQDSALAETAVHDALLAAISCHKQLDSPQLLRPWLYALTRNEVLRQLRRTDAAWPAQPTQMQPAFGWPALFDRARPRVVVQAALDMLDQRDREYLRLALAQELPARAVAHVLGAPRLIASRRLRAAGRRLDDMVTAISLAQRRADDCAELAELLPVPGNPSGTASGIRAAASVLDAAAVLTHRAGCGICAPRTLPPINTVAICAALPMAVPSPGLREQIIADVRRTDKVAYYGEAARPFQFSGFPVPLDRSGVTRRFVTLAAGVAILALLGATALWAIRPDSPQATAEEETTGEHGISATEVRPSRDASSTKSIPETPSPSSLSPSPGFPNSSSSSSGSSAAPSSAPKRRYAPPTSAPRSPTSPLTSASQAPRGRAPQVEASLYDRTHGCVSTWRASIGASINNDVSISSVTFVWSAPGYGERRVAMERGGTRLYGVTVSDLPVDVTVRWQVVAVSTTGAVGSTQPRNARHDCF